MVANRHDAYLHNLPSDWAKVSIEQIGDVFAGGTPSRTNTHYWNGTIAWATPSELTQLTSKWLTQTREYITEAGFASSGAPLLPKGSLLVTTRATIGSIAIAGIEVSTNQGFKNVVPNSFNDSLFYYYLLQFIAAEMQRLASGSTFDEISRRDFVRIIVPRPNLLEQRRIGQILDTIDTQIQETEKIIAKLQQIKVGLLHDLLTCGIDENVEVRNSVTHPEQFKESVLGKIPRKWSTNTLSKIITIIDCKHYTPTYKTAGIPIIRPRNVTVDGLDFSEGSYVSEEEYRFLTDKHEPRLGDIVFSRNASFGVPCYVETMQPFAIGQDVVIMTELLANTRFVYYTLLSSTTERQIKRLSTGSTFERINLAFIRNLIVPVPPREEQDYIATILRDCDIRVHSEEVYLNKLKQIKKGLMEDLLTGRVRVTQLAADDEK